MENTGENASTLTLCSTFFPSLIWIDHVYVIRGENSVSITKYLEYRNFIIRTKIELVPFIRSKIDLYHDRYESLLLYKNLDIKLFKINTLNIK